MKVRPPLWVILAALYFAVCFYADFQLGWSLLLTDLGVMP
jgi:hypothetical protein